MSANLLINRYKKKKKTFDIQHKIVNKYFPDTKLDRLTKSHKCWHSNEMTKLNIA